MPRKKKAAEPGFNVFRCLLCADHPQFVAGTFSTHLADVHQMNPKAKYQKRTLAHLDAADWYQWDYEFLNDGVPFATHHVRNPRHPSDEMYWAEE